MAEHTDTKREPDLGDLVVVLLATTLRGLSCRLGQDGFPRAADIVMSLAMRCDHYILCLRSVPSAHDIDGERTDR
jgi:hypothetical protein